MKRRAIKGRSARRVEYSAGDPASVEYNNENCFNAILHRYKTCPGAEVSLLS